MQDESLLEINIMIMVGGLQPALRNKIPKSTTPMDEGHY
jgi:hypothetical protein